MTLAARRNDLRHSFVCFCPFILGLLDLYSETYSSQVYTLWISKYDCLPVGLAWRSWPGLLVQTRVGSFNWIKPDKTRFDLMNTKCESWGEFYSEFVLRFWKVLILRFGLQPRSNNVGKKQSLIRNMAPLCSFDSIIFQFDGFFHGVFEGFRIRRRWSISKRMLKVKFAIF